MLDAYRPIMLVTALWPTQDFEFPSEPEPFGQRLREQFGLFNEQRVLQAGGGQSPHPEVPRVVLLGEKRQWGLELAPAKITLRRTPSQPMAIDELFGSVGDQIGAIHAWLAENHNLRVYRLGLVVRLFCNTRSSANEKIAHYFLHPRALQNQSPHEVKLEILSRLALEGGVIVNRWLRVRPLRTTDSRHVDFAAQIEIDLNTATEDTSVKTVRDLQRFIEAAQHHLAHDIPVLDDPDFLA